MLSMCMKLQNKYIVKLGPPNLMWCVHTRWGMPTIKRWGNLSCIQSDVDKTRENNWNIGKINWAIN